MGLWRRQGIESTSSSTFPVVAMGVSAFTDLFLAANLFRTISSRGGLQVPRDHPGCRGQCALCNVRAACGRACIIQPQTVMLEESHGPQSYGTERNEGGGRGGRARRRSRIRSDYCCSVQHHERTLARNAAPVAYFAKSGLKDKPSTSRSSLVGRLLFFCETNKTRRHRSGGAKWCERRTKRNAIRGRKRSKHISRLKPKTATAAAATTPAPLKSSNQKEGRYWQR